MLHQKYTGKHPSHVLSTPKEDANADLLSFIRT